jgi:hypothetical protein
MRERRKESQRKNRKERQVREAVCEAWIEAQTLESLAECIRTVASTLLRLGTSCSLRPGCCEMAFRALKGGDCEKHAYATKLIGKNERIASQKLSQEASIMPMGPSGTRPLPMRLGWPIRPDQGPERRRDRGSCGRHWERPPRWTLSQATQPLRPRPPALLRVTGAGSRLAASSRRYPSR